ncbi:MAG TPA: cytochrome b N-terminal domain-containing protein [Bryobacteraceae bacterium]|nr:cytochrome b N-terminal domain-containing protein [Bryobacteraceae bacterium]
MKGVARRAADWIEQRTGFETFIRSFLFEDIPASTGWPHVFGSIAIFLFLTQAFSGILLAFNFAPTPGEAYNSLTYIMRSVTAGRMIRGLHHWGATMMIVVVAIHMVQVFLYGAYKKPRETTWVVGVTLFLITLAFGLTGYLLPWDNKAYWGTSVTATIASQAPFIGGYLRRLMGAEDGVGVVTFARFYDLHTLILPGLMALLVVVHIYLVRRHGIAPAPSDEHPSVKFFPRQVFRDTVAIFITFVILFLASLLIGVPLERLADPTDTTYIPRPDWYFLFLFQALKFFRGPLEPIGSVVLPTAFIAVLFAVPFLDRSRVRRLRQRTAAIAITILAIAGWGALTMAAIITTPSANTDGLTSKGDSESWASFSPEELAGVGYFRQEHCESCHNLIDGDPKVGPNLASLPVRRSAEWMIEHFKNPSQLIPGSNMPPIHLPDAGLNALSAFLLKLTPENAARLMSAPSNASEAAETFVTSGCGGCHKVNGTGGDMGPPLNGISSRRSKEWIARHFDDPQKLSPGSIMPPYRFAPSDQNALISYLFSLPAH